MGGWINAAALRNTSTTFGLRCANCAVMLKMCCLWNLRMRINGRCMLSCMCPPMQAAAAKTGSATRDHVARQRPAVHIGLGQTAAWQRCNVLHPDLRRTAVLPVPTAP
eukprot:8827649-Lingulodinium_polyedra.AAC.1